MAHFYVPSQFRSARLATRLLIVSSVCLVFGQTVRGAEFVLSDFSNEGFDYTFDNFSQTLGPTATRVTDLSDGWGGAGVGGVNFDLSPYADGRLVIDLTTHVANGIDRFDLELIDRINNNQTQRSGKWTFDVSGLTPGVPTTLVSQTTISSPVGGIGSFQSFDPSEVMQWQVLGEFGSAQPFDISFDKISISNEVVAPPPYAGAESDAPWRTQAASQIESIRKADLSIAVVDAVGNPVPGAVVDVVMQQHEFGFGSAVQAFRLRDNAAQHDQYKEKVVELFNVATLENNLKWPAWEGEWGGLWSQSGAVSAIDFLNNEGVDVRGHALVWPGRDNLPADIRQMLGDGNLSASEQTLVRSRIAAHIAQIGAATNGKLVAWDVINETRTNNDLMNELSEGDQALVTWFQQADAAAPNADLYLNDFGILNSWGGASDANRDQYFATIQSLKDQGAPIEGIGFQGHFREDDLTGPEELWTVLDRFEQLGLKMQITEFDFESTNEELQAAYLRDFLTAMFSHDGVDDLLLWGFWEDAHWRPDAALFRSDWSIKPNGQAYLDLVFDEWWTDEQLAADANGTTSTRGFKGDYELRASYGDAVAILDTTLSDDGSTSLLVLDTLVGDYNRDGRVDAADYTVWRDTLGSTSDLAADGDNNGVVDSGDYSIWKAYYGSTLPAGASVPEPTAILSVATLWLAMLGRPAGRRSACA